MHLQQYILSLNGSTLNITWSLNKDHYYYRLSSYLEDWTNWTLVNESSIVINMINATKITISNCPDAVNSSNFTIG